MFFYIVKNIFVVLWLNVMLTNYANAAKIKGSDIDKINEVFGIIQDKYPDYIKNDAMITGALDGMLKSLDQYSAYYSPDEYIFMRSDYNGRYGGIGITYTMLNQFYKITNVISGDAADLAGIRKGDVITQVDNIPVNTLSFAKVSNMIRGPIGKKVKITVLRQEKEILNFIITRQEIKAEDIIYDTYDNIAIFKITSFSQQTYDQLLFGIKKIVLQNKNINSIILDLRDNPGGALEAAFDVSNLFLQDYVKIVSIKTKENYVLEEYVANDLPDIIHGLPIVILVNNESASASEIVAAALQDNKRAVLVGETTFGKATVQAFVELVSVPGAAVKITTGHYYTPKDSKIDKVGITPDVEIKNPNNIKPTNEDLIVEGDIQMKKAIQIASDHEKYRRLLKHDKMVISARRW